jgi:lon-related putative ATP-dependent protease
MARKKPKGLSLPMELPAGALSHRCKPEQLGFKTTDKLPDLQDVIGQPRALRALELGSEVAGPGYNIFVLGIPGSGRTTLSQEYLIRKAAAEPVPDDWCYVNNFADPRSPHLLRLPAGRGAELSKDLEELVQYCLREVPRAFESPEYTKERERLVEEFKQAQEAEFQQLQEYTQKYSFAVVRTPFGLVLVPAPQGKPLTPEEMEKLSAEQRAKLEQLQTRLVGEVDKSVKRLRELGNAASERLIELNRRTLMFLIEPSLNNLHTKYAGLEKVLAFIETAQNDILENNQQFLPQTGGESSQPLAPGRSWTQRYAVNVLVDNSRLDGAPVIVETHPVLNNLIGRIEHEVVMGATHTDFTMIRPGALHRANGGYLILPARDVLTNPYTWEGLKRVLRDGCIRIVDVGSQLGLISTVTLEPEPVPLNLKVILVGTPVLYYLLKFYDEDFSKLFKVRAEFATLMDRNPETEKEYGLFVKSVVIDNHLPPFDNTAVARIIEHSSRIAEDQYKLSTQFGRIADLVREAAFWTKKDDGAKPPVEVVTARDVQRAINESIYRNNQLDERMQELVSQDILMIDVSGAQVGRVNALSVLSLGDYAFGRPSRLSAVVSCGKGGVIDIERQAKLGGPIHTKGIMILSGYLHSHYGRNAPLSLSASLTFEQSYSEVEGDSASAAELIALISAIGEIPLRQDLAITGSVNQHGQIQAIGGVNEKIEGFFSTCAAKGLTGSQGVLIPKANQRHLMLKQEVIDTVTAGKFHIWPITTIEEGLALMTGLAVGVLQADGKYPKGSINERILTRLAEFARVSQAAAADKTDSANAQEGL